MKRRKYGIWGALAALGLAWAVVPAQNGSTVDMAHQMVVNKMTRDWGEKVSVNWTATHTNRIAYNTVKVNGDGLVSTTKERGRMHFTYAVTMYPNTNRSAIVTYDVRNIDNSSLGGRWDKTDTFDTTAHQRAVNGPRVYNDKWFQQRARTLVEKELERQTRLPLKVEYAYATMWYPNNRERGVKGTGAMWSTSRNRKGLFTYEVRFNRATGKVMHTEVKVESKPG